MANPFVHCELMTSNPEKAKDFFQSLFDWKLENMPMQDGSTYTMIRVGDGTGGGIMKNPMPGGSAAWVPYVLVDDVKAATAKAKSLGAKVHRDVSEIPELGSFSIIADPTGGIMGLWQAKRK